LARKRSLVRIRAWAAALKSDLVPAFGKATQGVDPHEAGVASATVNTGQQIGGSLGIALLNTIAAKRYGGLSR